MESGVYPMEVEIAYLGQSQSGANSVTVHFKAEDGKVIRQTEWVTSGTAKGCKNFYETTDREGNVVKRDLPGFARINGLAMLTAGIPVGQMDTEEKIVKLYDFDAGKEMPKAVQAITGLSGQKVIAGVLKKTVDKMSKNDAGEYVPNGETREVNEVDKLFCAHDGKEGLTLNEVKAGVTPDEEGIFIKGWEEKWTGVTKDESTKDAGGAKQGAPASKAAPSKSLFA